MSTSPLSLFKDRLMEAIKYDYNHWKLPPVLLARAFLQALIYAGKYETALKMVSNLYRTGWAGSDRLGVDFARHLFNETAAGEELVAKSIASVQPLPQTQKFFADPLKMLGGILIVLKSASENEKGVVLLKYSYYFALLPRLFDLGAILQRYNLILEPSWAGFFELDILAYGQLPEPVYLMVYEKRDKHFIDSLEMNLITVDVGPSWFVNYENFVAPETGSIRDIDIIMVASWAKFKRHRYFFKALAELKARGVHLNVALVGYPADMKKDDIQQLAALHNVDDMLTIYEWIPPSEVASLFQRSKLNIVWSRFEGNNRAIIEGMFCDVPALLREGHNYGEHYDYINPMTGRFANDKNLADSIVNMLSEGHRYSPRKYVMENRNCVSATNIMNKVIQERELQAGRDWTRDLAVKVNELHGMAYLNSEAGQAFEVDYDWLAKQVRVPG